MWTLSPCWRLQWSPQNLHHQRLPALKSPVWKGKSISEGGESLPRLNFIRRWHPGDLHLCPPTHRAWSWNREAKDWGPAIQKNITEKPEMIGSDSIVTIIFTDKNTSTRYSLKNVSLHTLYTCAQPLFSLFKLLAPPAGSGDSSGSASF